MDLLERLPAAHRARLEKAAVTFRLGRGELLMRRGERGGDVFRVAEGLLEIIDSRVEPPVVLDRVGAGAVVGEMAFLDEAMRSADVRAAEESVCQHWPRDRLLGMLEDEPALGLAFYRALAELVNERSRVFRTLAMTEGLATRGARGNGSFSTTAAAEQAEQQLLDALRERLMEAEPVARTDREGARTTILDALSGFARALGSLLLRMNAEQRAATMARVGRDVHPYLVRSHLGELAMDRPSGRSEDPEALGHLLAGAPVGDGAVGEFIDEWLLARPTARALRARRVEVQRRASITGALPPRTVVINGIASGLAASIVSAARSGQVVTVVEQDRALLSGTSLPSTGDDVSVRLQHEKLAGVALGDQPLRLGAHDLVVLDGLMDYLPDRPAATLLGQVRGACAPGARILLTGLLPARDELLFSDLLAWPLVRRTDDALEGIVARAGFKVTATLQCDRAGLVVEGKASSPDDAA